jgi:hypothetical protein
MADSEIGIPITFHVIRHLWPDKESDYLDFLAANLHDPAVGSGRMTGGQQYLDSLKPDRTGMPMGLARYILTET